MAEVKKRQRTANSGQHVSIDSRAVEVLAGCGITSLPISVEFIAMQLGLQVERAVLGDGVSGLLVVQDGRGLIGVNSAQPAVRQRFTIAHEIGHFVLHKEIMPVFIDKQFLRPYLAAFRDSTSSAGQDFLEREANGFAAALLMPAQLIRQAITELGVDVSDDDAIEGLAKKFQVSRQAMTFRLANLAIPVSNTK